MKQVRGKEREAVDMWKNRNNFYLTAITATYILLLSIVTLYYCI